jgi:hypothetical protein
VRAASIAIVLAIAVSPAARAQTPAKPAASPQEQLKARSNISIMEGVLQRAVVMGADSLNRRVRDLAPQGMLVIGGAAEVRGFRIEGYGVFFDVEVPVLRQSVAWQIRALMDQTGVPLSVALQQLRAYILSIDDARVRQQLEQALRRIELQVGPAPEVPGAASVRNSAVSSPRPGAPAVPRELPAPALAVLNDPNGAYTQEVKNALIDAMLEHSGPLAIATDEWLTVAARDNEPHDRLNPGDDLGSIILRIKGSDLAALHAGRMTVDEARSLVEVREY